jgi:hypothetical protein
MHYRMRMAGHATFVVRRAHALNGVAFAVGRDVGERGAHRTVEIDESQNGRLPLHP